MIDVLEAAAELQQVCEQERWRYCFIGGLALQHWGEPRFTRDADLTLLTGFGEEEFYAKKLLAHFDARIPNPVQFAIERRILLLKSGVGIGLDIAFAGIPFEVLAVERAILIDFGTGISLRICTAEDLIVLKAFAGRGKDWLDIEGVILRQAGRLDWEHIWIQLGILANYKEQPELLEQLKRLKESCEKKN